MGIEYRELRDDDVEQCLDLQRRVFGFSETELISTHILKMLVRKKPPMGVVVGAFMVDGIESRLIGLMVGFATFQERSVYLPLGGVLPEFQAGLVANKMMRKFREVAMSIGLKTMYALHEPLEIHLSRLYYGGMGYVGIEYLMDGTAMGMPADKVLARWEFDSPHTIGKLGGDRTPDLLDLVNGTPMATGNHFPDDHRVLMEVPQDFIGLKADDPDGAARLRLETRKIFNEYLNERDYVVADCVSGKLENGRASFYVLEKRSGWKNNGGTQK